ncbi:MAG: hypothetical protein Q9161_005965 [Pseudevernia consocians]
MSSDLGSETSEFSEIFGTVKDTITSLMQTSIIIRNATPRDRYIRAQTSAKDPFLESFDIAHVGHKFPKIDSEGREWLKRRLGKAIAQRRQYLKYCREHNDKFWQSTKQDQLDVDAPLKNKSLSGDLTRLGNTSPMSGSRYEAGTVRSVPTSALAPTDASTLQPSRLEVAEGMATGDTEDVSDSYSQTSKHVFTDIRPQLPALIKASRQSVDRIPATACPLCHWDATLSDLNKQTPSDETLVVTLEQFRQHLGAHMEQLALFALPRSYKEEENANSNEAAAMAHSDSQSRHLSTEEMSWKTLSSREMTIDKAIPDVSTSIAPDIGVHPRDSNPWSCKLLDISKCEINPLNSYKAAVSQRCSKEGDLYVHSGNFDSARQKQDMWTIETNGTSTCYPIATNSRGPGPRSYHAALLVGNTFIVFGGVSKKRIIVKAVDNILFLMDTSTKTWSTAAPRTRPSARWGHTLSLIGTTVLLFGGRNEDEYFNDLLALDLNGFQIHPNASWETLMPNESHPNRPPKRLNHTMVSWDQNLYLFGGSELGRVLESTDVWEYHSRGNYWNRLDCIGEIPQARENHAAAVVDGVMYIFGGRNGRNQGLGILVAFRIATRHWYRFENMGSSPSPRSGHQMCVHNEKIFVVGGLCYGQEEPESIYTLDTSKIRFTGNGP